MLEEVGDDDSVWVVAPRLSAGDGGLERVKRDGEGVGGFNRRTGHL